MSLNLTGKNLIPYPYKTSTTNIQGVDFTVNEDGSVLVNGANTSTTSFCWFQLTGDISFKEGEPCFLSGCPSGGSFSTYKIRTASLEDTGNGALINKTASKTQIYIVIGIGATVENLLFKPMLNKGTKALPYEPYKSINPENIKVSMSSNLIVYPYRYNSLNDNGIAYTTNDNGEIIANGSIEDNAKYSQFSLNADPKIFNIQKDIYTMSCPMSLNDKSHEAQFWLNFYLDGVWKFVHSVNNTTLLTKTIDLREKEFNQVYGYVRILGKDTGTFENFTFKPMLNKGTTALPYEPYIAPKDVEKVVVAKSPNLIPYPYRDSSPKILNGITFTVNDDNSVTANGISTATANFLCLSLSSLSLKKGEYTLSSGLTDDNTPVTYGITFGYKYENSNRTVVSTKNGAVSIVLTENAMCDVIITVRANQTLDNLTFYPMLNKGTTALPYQKYDREVVWSKTSTSDDETTSDEVVDDTTVLNDEGMEEETTLNEVTE